MIIWIASYQKVEIHGLELLSTYYYTQDGFYDAKQLEQIPDYPNRKNNWKKY